MKNVKALLRHEWRNIWPVAIYFLGCFIAGISTIGSTVQSKYAYYLAWGYEWQNTESLLAILGKLAGVYMVAIGLGLLVLIYLQFRDNKSTGVSSFIKSLPYTNGQIYSVKLISGITIYTVPFILGCIGLVIIRQGAIKWYSNLQDVFPLGDKLQEQNSIGTLLTYMMLIYSITLFVYLFLFLMQYIVNQTVVSLVISGLTLGAIPFMPLGLYFYLDIILGMEVSTKFRQFMEGLMQVLSIPVHIILERGTQCYIYMGKERSYYREYALSDMAWGKIGLFMLLSVVMLIAIYLMNKSYKAEKQEAFVSTNWAKKILIVGVTACSAGVVGIIGTQFITELFFINPFIIGHIGILVGGLIGYIVIKKICTIGKY